MKHLNFVDMTTTERDGSGHTKRVDMPYGALPSSFDLFVMNDAHVGNAALMESGPKDFVRRVKRKKNSYVVCQGDNIEAISVTDPRFDLDVHRNRGPRFDAQRDAFIEMFDAIGDKFLWILDGNHETKLRNIVQPNRDISKKFNAVYAEGVIAKALFPGFRMLSWHGWGQVNSRAGDEKQRRTNDQISLKRKLRLLPGADCDVIACGHFHKLILHSPDPKLLLVSDASKNELAQHYTVPSRIWIDEKKGLYRVPEEERHYMCCGSFLKAYDENTPSYAEAWGLEATELGYGHIVVKNDKLEKVETVALSSWGR